jgi:hypothetical protein
MTSRLFGRQSPSGPEYSALRATPSRSIPPELGEKERSEAFDARAQQLADAFYESPEARVSDRPFLTMISSVADGGIVTMPPGEGLEQCVPVFSSPVRAWDYQRVLLPQLTVRYLGFSPLSFVQMLRELENVGVPALALDRCPRCEVFTAVMCGSVETPQRAVQFWALSKGQGLARQELYLAHAVELAQAGRLEAARDLALEMAGHVTLEDPDTHLLLGQIAVALRDRSLLAEARACLRVLEAQAWEEKLDAVARSGSPDFLPLASTP